MTVKNSVTIGLVQTRVSDNISSNMEKTIAKIREAANKGAQIICLQELYRTKYFPTDERKDVTQLAETIPGETTSTLSSLAKELNVVIIAPIFEVGDSGKHYNTAVVIDADGTLMGSYRKMHIPHDPFFYEKNYFDVGDSGYRTFRTRHLSFGVLICYDQWFPEAARTLALQGADVIFYPSAIGYLEGDPLSYEDWHSAWENIQRSHAIANGIHVASVNRVGTEGNIRFWGASFVCDAFGRLLKRASQEDEEVVVTELDISQNKRIQEGWGFLRNRLPSTYGQISSLVLRETPKSLGYSMPAEWEKHDATWLAWPHDPTTFPSRVKKVEQSYLQIISALHKNEDINLFVKNLKMKANVTRLLKQKGVDLQKINFYVWDYADVWFRDYGPIFIVNKEKKQIAFVHWIFNAWGGKYTELMKDAQIPYIISNRLQLNNFRPGIVLEGGSVDVNGKGTLLTTEQCLLNSNRNPHLSKAEIENFLMNYFGVNYLIWLKGGVAGDDTDGHIDNLARFVDSRTVLCAYEEDEKDENHSVLRENYEILLQSTDQDGKKLKVIKMPMPPLIRSHIKGEKTRLPASYLNFYVANKVVLVPIFKHKNDRFALRIIQDAFPGRKVVGIDCTDMVYGMGAIHCVIQQQPAVI
ncbi:MAG: agmatine deiminase family protein [Thaumarchaeota archaeon]|nr:agmatine deiminase family protein [Nitrososphaerota archaeon]